jgi:hypothetical protein
MKNRRSVFCFFVWWQRPYIKGRGGGGEGEGCGLAAMTAAVPLPDGGIMYY